VPQPGDSGDASRLVGQAWARPPARSKQALGFPGWPVWECIPTPGHTPGHVSYFRAGDRVLISGDAVVTLKVNSWAGLLLQRPGLSGPTVVHHLEPASGQGVHRAACPPRADCWPATTAGPWLATERPRHSAPTPSTHATCDEPARTRLAGDSIRVGRATDRHRLSRTWSASARAMSTAVPVARNSGL